MPKNKSKVIQSFVSKWNVDSFMEIYNQSSEYDKWYGPMTNIKARLSDEGILTENYYYGKGYTEGRVYSGIGYQTLPRWIRNACMHGIYHDYDIQNAFPSLTHQILQHNNIQCTHLKYYVQNRDTYINNICNTYNMEYADVKTQILKIIHNGGLDVDITELVEFKFEFKQAVQQLKRRHVNLFNLCRKENNPDGTFIYRISSRAEAVVINAFISYNIQNGITTGVNMFDGLCTEESIDVDDLQKYIASNTPYSVTIVEKPIDILPYEFNEHQLWSDMNIVEHPYATRVLPYESHDVSRVVAIEAGMGLGKSYQMKKHIDRTRQTFFEAHGYYPRMCLISPRITLSHAHFGSLIDFTHYSENVSDDRLIIQYESLFKLESQKPFDYVYLDELHSICSNITSTITNGKHLKDNYEIFTLMARNATQVITMDADLSVDSTCECLIRQFAKPEEVTLHRYGHQKISKNVTISNNENDWVKAVREKLTNGKKVAICCQSKKRAKAWDKMFSCDYNTIIFTSDSDDETVATLRNMNEALNGCQLCIYTSKITVGTDHTNDWDVVFVDAGGKGGGCTAREMLQMVGRFRHTNDEQLLTLIGPSSGSFYQTPLEIEACIFKRKDFLQRYDKWLQSDKEWGADGLKFAPSPLTKMFAHTESERSRDFKEDFIRLVEKKGWTMTNDIAENEKNKKLITAKAAVEIDEMKLLESIYTEIKDMSNDELKQVAEDLSVKVTKQESTHRERETIRLCHNNKHYDHLEFDEMCLSLDNQRVIKTSAYYSRLNEDERKHHELRRMYGDNCADLTFKSEGYALQCLEKAMKKFGFNGIFDYEYTFTKPFINVDEIETLYSECYHALGHRVRLPNDSKRMLEGMLGIVMGLKIKSEKVRNNGERYRVYSIDFNRDLISLINRSDYYRNHEYVPIFRSEEDRETYKELLSELKKTSWPETAFALAKYDTKLFGGFDNIKKMWQQLHVGHDCGFQLKRKVNIVDSTESSSKKVKVK